MKYSGRVECCVCGIDCGPVDDWADEDGLPGHVLHNAVECKECEARLDAEEAEKGGDDVKSRMKQDASRMRHALPPPIYPRSRARARTEYS